VVRYASGEYFDLERFEEYWGEKPSVKQARVYFVPEDTTRMAKIQTGEVDLIVGCPYPSVQDMEKRPGLKVVRLDSNHPSPSVIFANRNPKVPWYHQKVRLAMAHAIDWNAIVKNLLHEIPNHWALIAPYELGYDPNVKPYTYDPKKAKELLNEAGFPKGFEFKLYYPITGRIPMVREIAEAIASYFEAVGIRTKLVGEEFAALLARRRASKTPDAEFVYIFSLPVAGGPTSIYFLSSSFTAQGNTSVYFNPKYESVINEARATVDDTKRAELVKRAVKILHEDVALIPIFNMVTVFVMKENIDFKPTRYYTDPIHIKDITVK
jgi:peptide/nickel transport system substrate-binding protein